jgi:hypothetical protein
VLQAGRSRVPFPITLQDFRLCSTFGRSVGIVRLRTKGNGVFFFFCLFVCYCYTLIMEAVCSSEAWISLHTARSYKPEALAALSECRENPKCTLLCSVLSVAYYSKCRSVQTGPQIGTVQEGGRPPWALLACPYLHMCSECSSHKNLGANTARMSADCLERHANKHGASRHEYPST